MDGLRAPFIIHDPDDPYKDQYDEELIVSVSGKSLSEMRKRQAA